MDPTYQNGDLLLVKKYDINPERYDVVVAKVENQNVIKRVIGVPGDMVLIKENKVFINGKEIKDNYHYLTEDSGIFKDEYHLKEDEYCLLGDNRQVSIDSRIYGGIKKENIKGVVLFRWFPFWKYRSFHNK